MCKLADWVIFVILVVCSIGDCRKKSISYVMIAILGICIVAFAILCDETDIGVRISGVLVGIIFLVISKCTKEAIGYGDSWIILLLGIHIGALKVLAVLSTAGVLAAVVSLFFLWKCRWKKQATLPFVPFMTISYLGAILL